MRPPALRPTTTRTGAKLPSAATTMTRLSAPVATSASLGISGPRAPSGERRVSSANMPGASSPSSLRNTTRARCVRLPASTCGSSASTSPVNVRPGNALTVALTAVPGRTPAVLACGIAASSQSVPVPLMRNIGMPATASCPSRTSTSLTTPSAGARSTTLPSGPALDPDSPSTRSRSRAAERRPRASADVAWSSARDSAIAVLQAGASTVASAWPRRTRS